MTTEPMKQELDFVGEHIIKRSLPKDVEGYLKMQLDTAAKAIAIIEVQEKTFADVIGDLRQLFNVPNREMPAAE